MKLEDKMLSPANLDVSAWSKERYIGIIKDPAGVGQAIIDAIDVSRRERRSIGPRQSKNPIGMMQAPADDERSIQDKIEDDLNVDPSETEIFNRNVIKYCWFPMLTERDRMTVLLKCMGWGYKAIARRLKAEGLAPRELHRTTLSDIYKHALKHIYERIR